MTETIQLIIPAFFAGILMFLAPCTLPLVPGYISFISGVNINDLKDPDKKKAAKKKIIKNGIFFIIGFSVIFVLFGILAGVAGQALSAYRSILLRIGGALIIFFGLFMLGVFKLKFLQFDKKLKFPSWLTIGKPGSSFVIGSAFAVGWTPCVGPILASILLLASTSGSIFKGGFLLLIFSLGLAVPFLIVTFLFTKASEVIAKMSKSLKWVSIIGGVFLILLGILLITDNFFLLLQWGYDLLEFINYDALEQYL